MNAARAALILACAACILVTLVVHNEGGATVLESVESAEDPILSVLKEPVPAPQPTAAPAGSNNVTNSTPAPPDTRPLTKMGDDGKYTQAPIEEGKLPVKPLTDFQKMSNAMDAAIKTPGPALDKAKALCAAKRKAASLECGKAFCTAGHGCGQPCPDGYRQPPAQVLPVEGYGQAGMMASFHVVHEVGNKERHSKELRDKELHAKELQKKEKASKFSYFGSVVEKEAEAKKELAAEVAVKEVAGKANITYESGQKMQTWQAEIVEVRANSTVACHTAGLKQLQVCEVRVAAEKKAKAAAAELKKKKAEQELIKIQEEKKEKFIDALMAKKAKAPGSGAGGGSGARSGGGLNADLHDDLEDAYASSFPHQVKGEEKVLEATEQAQGSAEHAAEEAAAVHLEEAAKAKKLLAKEEGINPESYASAAVEEFGSGYASEGEPGAVEVAYGMTPGKCAKLDTPACITTLGCHLDVDSDSCVEGEGLAVDAPDDEQVVQPKQPSFTDALQANIDPITGHAIVPLKPKDTGEYTGVNSNQGLLADAVKNALSVEDDVPQPTRLLQLDESQDQLDESQDQGLVPEEQGQEEAAPEAMLAQYGLDYAVTVKQQKVAKWKHYYDLATGSAKHDMSAEVNKTEAAQQASTSAEEKVTVTNATANSDTRVVDLYGEEDTRMGKAQDTEAKHLSEAKAEHAEFLKHNHTEPNCTSESTDTFMTCSENGTQFLIDQIKQWRGDGKNASDTYKKQIAALQEKETRFSQQAQKAAAALLEVRSASNKSVIAIAKRDNVSMDGYGPWNEPPPTPDFGDMTDEDDVAHNINPRKDLYVEDVDTKQCTEPRKQAYTSCESTFQAAYQACTGAFEQAAAGEETALDYMLEEQAAWDPETSLIEEEGDYVEAEPLDW